LVVSELTASVRPLRTGRIEEDPGDVTGQFDSSVSWFEGEVRDGLPVSGGDVVVPAENGDRYVCVVTDAFDE
jgi:hypothetical protein